MYRPVCLHTHIVRHSKNTHWKEGGGEISGTTKLSGVPVHSFSTGQPGELPPRDPKKFATRESQYIRVAAVRTLRFVSSKIIRGIRVLFHNKVWRTGLIVLS